MGESRPSSAPMFWRVILGRRLADLREQARMSQEDAGKILDVAVATVRRMERAEVGLKPLYVRALLQAYGLPTPEADAFMELVEQANTPGWWHKFRDVVPTWFSTYVALEDAASLIRAYEPHYFPGLLQTEDYARAVLSAGLHQTVDDLERQVAVRIKRQELLLREDAPTLWVLMEESVLHRPVGGPGVTRAQLQRTLEASWQPNVKIQILPLGIGAHPGTFGPFTFLRFKVNELPDGVYVEDLANGEFRDRPDDVTDYLETMDQMAGQAATIPETRMILEQALKKA
ncbi:helix-turn-helix transcriptional regulator [Streptomyces chrestomyceticus]|uniref:helix-turn-helix domain-containing protein n=1 Tax=Streptomyces chrestomyceticus TaxID=68185 RepID=UPI0033DADF96